MMFVKSEYQEKKNCFKQLKKKSSLKSAFTLCRDANCSDYRRYSECCNLTKAHWIYGKN